MIIILVLGLFAALYVLWLVFSLAAYALPFWAGITVAFFLHHHDSSILASLLGGFAAGIMVLVAGQVVFSTTRSPLVRGGVALLYAIPAGIAGYHTVHGFGQMAIGAGVILTILSWIGAFVIATAALRRLASIEAGASPLPPTAEVPSTTAIETGMERAG